MEEMSNSQSSQYKLLDGNIVDAVSLILRPSFSFFGIDIYYFLKLNPRLERKQNH